MTEVELVKGLELIKEQMKQKVSDLGLSQSTFSSQIIEILKIYENRDEKNYLDILITNLYYHEKVDGDLYKIEDILLSHDVEITRIEILQRLSFVLATVKNCLGKQKCSLENSALYLENSALYLGKFDDTYILGNKLDING